MGDSKAQRGEQGDKEDGGECVAEFSKNARRKHREREGHRIGLRQRTWPCGEGEGRGWLVCRLICTLAQIDGYGIGQKLSKLWLGPFDAREARGGLSDRGAQAEREEREGATQMAATLAVEGSKERW